MQYMQISRTSTKHNLWTNLDIKLKWNEDIKNNKEKFAFKYRELHWLWAQCSSENKLYINFINKYLIPMQLDLN